MELYIFLGVIIAVGVLVYANGSPSKNNRNIGARKANKTSYNSIISYETTDSINEKEDWVTVFWRLASGGRGNRYKRKEFLSKDQLAFFNNLITKYGNHYSIHCKVDLSSIVSVSNRGLYYISDYFFVDYLIYSRKTKEILLVIKLGEQTEGKGKNNKILDEILRQANIPLYRITDLNQDMAFKELDNPLDSF